MLLWWQCFLLCLRFVGKYLGIVKDSVPPVGQLCANSSSNITSLPARNSPRPHKHTQTPLQHGCLYRFASQVSFQYLNLYNVGTWDPHNPLVSLVRPWASNIQRLIRQPSGPIRPNVCAAPPISLVHRFWCNCCFNTNCLSCLWTHPT